MFANRQSRGERESAEKCLQTCVCSMSQLCPTFWLRLEIHQSASNTGSSAKMKESLEAVAEGSNTHVHTLLNTCTHDMETVRRRRYMDTCAFVCVLAHYYFLGQGGLIRF